MRLRRSKQIQLTGGKSRFAHEAESHLQVDVTDNGPGIPDALRAKLFTAFASADKKAGLGLGLAVSKEIVAVHGGEITAAHTENGGTLMTVILPRRTGAAAILDFDPTSSKSTLDRSA